MESKENFCSCNNFNCTLHPTKHDKGCTPCISKNLKLKEIPNCFFNLVNGAESRKGDFFEDFARLVLEGKEEQACNS